VVGAHAPSHYRAPRRFPLPMPHPHDRHPLPSDDHRLLPSIRNEVFRMLETAGLDTTEFEWDEENSHGVRVSRLWHNPSEFSLLFDYVAPHHQLVLHPGDTERLQRSPIGRLRDLMHYYAAVWVAALKRELAQPDLFALAAEAAKTAETLDTDERLFTREELIKIDDRLDRVEAAFTERLKGAEENIEALRAEVEFLKHSARESKVKGWYRQAAWSLLQLSLRASDLSAAREAFGSAWRLLFGGEPPAMIGG
jgi:hypothetical protein